MNGLEDLLTYGLLTREEMLKLSGSAGFAQPQVVELFRWDLELVSQLQGEAGDFILKGGAATQLYIPIEKQRGSVDVDMLFPRRQDQLSGIIRAVNAKFVSHAPLFQFSVYEPKSPTVGLPMKTYDVDLPSVITNACRIKLDVLLIDEDIPLNTVRRAKTFACTVEKATCPTAGALIGDKLLTLARGSIGIQTVEDYPKQVYDLEMLAYQRECGIQELTDAVRAVEVLTPVEGSFRGLDIKATEALEDVMKTMSEYSKIDLSSADKPLKKAVNDFQQFFVNRSEMGTKLYQWSCRFLRMRFLASLIQLHLMGKISLDEAAKSLRLSRSISNRAKSIKGIEVEKARSALLKLSKGAEAKELRGKPLDRVFWGNVEFGNIEQLDRLV